MLPECTTTTATLRYVGVMYQVMNGLDSSSSRCICRGALRVCYVNIASVRLYPRISFGFAFG